MIEYVVLIIAGIIAGISVAGIVFFYVYSHLKKDFEKLKHEFEIFKERYKGWLFELSIGVRDLIADRILEVTIPLSLRQKLIEAVSKKVIESFSIYTEEFRKEGLDPSDAVHLGEPIDFLVFDGWQKENVKQIVFVEVKSGEKLQWGKVEKQIKELVENQRDKIRWVTLDFTGEKLVDERKIREMIETGTEKVEMKNRILRSVRDEELKEFCDNFLKEKEQQIEKLLNL